MLTSDRKKLTRTGLLFSFLLSLTAVPIRLMEGQWNNPAYFITSQLILWSFGFLCWFFIAHLEQDTTCRQRWVKAISGILICIVLSNLSHLVAGPFFDEDPLKTTHVASLPYGLTRLSIRGVLVWCYLFPIVFFYISQKEISSKNTEIERLKQENMLSQLHFLRQQLDPHFMLNSLSILKAGIEDEWGKRYIVQLCNVYRYLITENEKYTNMIPVYKEVEFVRAYYEILKARYGESIRLEIRLDDAVMSQYIPPMALQTLVENAVKHNTASDTNPLTILIFYENGQIVIRNNLQSRNWAMESFGVGIENLRERYRLLARKPVTIVKDSTHFSVRLYPLPDPA